MILGFEFRGLKSKIRSELVWNFVLLHHLDLLSNSGVSNALRLVTSHDDRVARLISWRRSDGPSMLQVFRADSKYCTLRRSAVFADRRRSPIGLANAVDRDSAIAHVASREKKTALLS